MVLMGCIAEDLAIGSDLAARLARSGVAVNLRLGTPDAAGTGAPADEIAPFEVVALGRRALPAAEAVAAARAAWDRLAARGATRCHWAYRATGPEPDDAAGAVADALADALGEAGSPAIHACASPEDGIAVRAGRLLAAGASPVADGADAPGPAHDVDLVARLRRGTPRPVATLGSGTVRAGRAAIAAELDALAAAGAAHVVADAVSDLDLVELVRASEGRRLLCGAVAFAGHVPALCRVRGWLPAGAPARAGSARGHRTGPLSPPG